MLSDDPGRAFTCTGFCITNSFVFTATPFLTV
jgi:hypothetical protein